MPKNLTEVDQFTAIVTVPVDDTDPDHNPATDRRTAFSLQGAFQALANRTRYLFNKVSQVDPNTRFQLSGSMGSSTNIAASFSDPEQPITVSIPAGKKLKLKRARYAVGHASARLYVNGWEASSQSGEETPDATIYDNSAGGTPYALSLVVGIKNTTGSSISVTASGWWLDFAIE